MTLLIKQVQSGEGKRGGDNGHRIIITESGLYKLILRSRKPEAIAFQNWITQEVLPTIRKTGGYIKGAEDMTDSEILDRALQIRERQIDEGKLLNPLSSRGRVEQA